ncbi:MAG: ferric reductase-like transmembrane domain-containing protein [Chloroflexota bacterium]|nr:ferric reductase-like transmembrane domain-containing protein [Chloroflexota bacterium]
MDHGYWYLSRSAGFVAYLLLFLAVVLGLAVNTRFTERFFRRNTAFDLHRFIALLALAGSAFHTYILLGDNYFGYDAWQLSVPFWKPPYRAWQTAAGVAALYAIAIIVTSFYVRRFIGYRTWRALHYLTFGTFALAALHGITSGTDSKEPWATAIYVATIAVALGLVAYRLRRALPADGAVRSMRLAAGLAAALVAMLLLFGTGLVDVQRGPWAAASLPVLQKTPPAPYEFLPRFNDRLTGTYSRTRDATGSHVTITGVAAGDAPMRLDVHLDEGLAAGVASEPGLINEARASDAGSGEPLCIGTVKTLDRGYLQVFCDGRGPYAGTFMRIGALIRAEDDGSFTADLSGNMQHAAGS